MDIKQKCREVIATPIVGLTFDDQKVEFCQAVLAHIETLEKALADEKIAQGNLLEYYSQQDVGTGVHRLAAVAEQLLRIAASKG